MDEEQCELSMGMSGDFELAVWNSVLKLISSYLIILTVALPDCILKYLIIMVLWMLFSSQGNELTPNTGMGFFGVRSDSNSL